jgi:hypothetical protein
VNVSGVKKLERLEKRLFNDELSEWKRREAYAQILNLVVKEWCDRVKQLEDVIERS